MDKSRLTPIADILLEARLDTLSYSHSFTEDHDRPPTTSNKAHHLRSAVQAAVVRSETLALGAAYSEFGRVQIEDQETGQKFLLRSGSAVAIENGKRQGSLFDATKYLKSDVMLLVYEFTEDGLDLSITGTKHVPGKSRLEPTGSPAFVGSWSFSGSDVEFDQGEIDYFNDLLGDADEEEGEAE